MNKSTREIACYACYLDVMDEEHKRAHHVTSGMTTETFQPSASYGDQ